MDLQTVTNIEQLEAMAYREIKTINRGQNNLAMIEGRIDELNAQAKKSAVSKTVAPAPPTT